MKIASNNIENLYHLTSLDNFKRIKQYGCIMMTTDKSFGKSSELTGVFLLDIANLIKNWQFSPQWSGHLGYKLLKHVAGNSDEIVCLKIPTSKLKQQDLYIRSQNNLFDYLYRKKGDTQHAINGLNISDADVIPSKDAVEFVYEHTIALKDVEITGKSKTTPLKLYDFDNFKQKISAMTVFDNLLKDKPEAKLLNLYI